MSKRKRRKDSNLMPRIQVLMCQRRKVRQDQGFTAVKMNATGSVNMLDSPGALDGAIERLQSVTALGLDAGLGR